MPYRTSAMIPTISARSPNPPCPTAIGFPIGSSPGQNLLAAASLMSTTFGAPVRSAAVKLRPRSNGTRIAFR